MQSNEEEWTVAKAIASLQALVAHDPKNAELKVAFSYMYDGELQTEYVTGFLRDEGNDYIELVEG